MTDAEIAHWREVFDRKAVSLYPSSDPSHDILHIRRVVAAAMKLAEEEGGDAAVVLPAAYFHDFVNVPKDDPRRKEASRLSAVAAVAYLAGEGYPALHLEAVAHAIAAHSFSAGIVPETVEAKIVQDADRLDALGAIGLARLFSVSALLQRPYYHEGDPWAFSRAPDDGLYAIDHCEIKLFRIAETMQTKGGRIEAGRRVAFIRAFLEQMKAEML